MICKMNRREFLGGTAAGLMATGAGTSSAQPARRSILNYNENMDYRPLGKTGLMVSAACLGGHWKRLDVIMGPLFKGMGAEKVDYDNVNNPAFIKNRHEVVSRAIEVGINYIDACAGPEVLTYSKVLKGRRDKMYLGYSWYEREPRFKEWRSGKKLIEGLDMSLKQTGLDYVDVWRITLPEQNMEDLGEITRIEEVTAEAHEIAKKQGKARFTGISTHNRVWLKSMIEQYARTIDVVLFPYTPASKELPRDSVFQAIRKHRVGVFGIKPFGSNALFKGNSATNSPDKEEDDRKARLAIRYVLGNPDISAPIAGVAHMQHVDNLAKAILERRKLDGKERAELEQATTEMWARMAPNYAWLRNWEYV